MVVWLRKRRAAEPGAVGVDSGVVRREALVRLATLDDALVQVRADCEAQAEAARREASALVEDARSRVEQLVADAERRFEQSARLGYAAGRQRALDEWHAVAVRGAVDGGEALTRMHDRLARVVVQAVEQVIATSDRAALYRRVGALLDKAIADSSFMTVTVAVEEAGQAREAFDAIAAEAGWRLPVQVVGDDRLPPGACLCEWDYGSLDASLDHQLAGLRRAVRRGVERLGMAARHASPAHAAGIGDADAGHAAAGDGEDRYGDGYEARHRGPGASDEDHHEGGYAEGGHEDGGHEEGAYEQRGRAEDGHEEDPR